MTEKADMKLLDGAVREAGKLALSYFGRSPETQLKTDGTQVSEADLAVDDFLKKTLMGARPGYGWLSEETEDDLARLTKSHVWMVDPIDGTRAFLKEKPQWTVSAALVENGLPVIACVYNPVEEEFFAAVRGQGAYKNGRSIRVSGQDTIAGCRMVGPQGMFRARYWTEPWPQMEVFWANSIAYRLCLVASGAADATISMSNKSDWDLAAAQLLVQEAGGILTTHTGAEMTFNGAEPRQQSVVAAGPALHRLLLERTRDIER